MVKRISKKVCLLGDGAVGKTSLIRRYVLDSFDDKYITTIGTKVSKKVINYPKSDDGEGIELSLMIWATILCEWAVRQSLRKLWTLIVECWTRMVEFCLRPISVP